MHTLLYTVTFLAPTLWLKRREQRFKLGIFNRRKKSLTLYSPKAQHFLDDDDREKIRKVAEDATASKKEAEIEIGCVEVLLWEDSQQPGVVSIRVGGHDQRSQEDQESEISGEKIPHPGIDPSAEVVSQPAQVLQPFGAIDSWTEIATWNVSRGIRFNSRAHPAFKKDADALAVAANEAVRGGSGVFHSKVLPGSSIFGGNYHTEL